MMKLIFPKGLCDIDHGHLADLPKENGLFTVSIGFFVVISKGKVVFIDCDMGPSYFECERYRGIEKLQGGVFARSLKDCGFTFKDTDLVLPTRLHEDHADDLI
jgi:hypothetical protein